MSNPDIDRLYDRVSALFKLVEQKDRRIDKLNTALSAANDSINAALDRICELERTVVRISDSAPVKERNLGPAYPPEDFEPFFPPDFDPRTGAPCNYGCQVACQHPCESSCMMAEQQGDNGV
jgi:hypothetical protein